jgi:hypothetical protein
MRSHAGWSSDDRPKPGLPRRTATCAGYACAAYCGSLVQRRLRWSFANALGLLCGPAATLSIRRCPLVSGHIWIEIGLGKVEVRWCRLMNLTHRGVPEAGACHSRCLTVAVGAVMLIVSVVACGNSIGAEHNSPSPTKTTSNTPVPTGGGPSVGGDSLPPPSAPTAAPSSTSHGLEGPESPSPTPNPQSSSSSSSANPPPASPTAEAP